MIHSTLHLAWPWMFLLLPLPWLVTRLLPAAQPSGAAIFLPFAAALTAESAPAPPRLTRGRGLLFALIWLALITAGTRPQWLGEPQPVPTTGRRLLLAVDASGSMATKDMAGGATRLQVVKFVAGDFIKRRQGDQVGLILFGTRPYLQAPLTADLATVEQFLQESMIGIAGPQTAIGDAIGLAIKRLREDAASGGKSSHPSSASASPDLSASASASKAGSDTIMILLTDGSNDAGAMPPLEAAKLAAADGLRIYTIGVGAAEGSGMFGLGGGNTDLDEDTLKEIAQTTGGEYFRATDVSALQRVYSRIDQLEPAAGREQWYRPRTEWYCWPLGLALLLSVPAVVLGRGGRITAGAAA